MDVLVILGVVFAGLEACCVLVTMVLAFFEYPRRKKEVRTKYLSSLILKFIDDPEFLALFRLFDYENDADLAKAEKEIDRMLLFFENIMILKEEGTISESDFARFDYFVRKVVLSRHTREYFKFLSSHCKEEKTTFMFPLLLKYQQSSDAVYSD